MAEITITKQNFEAEVLNADVPVLVDFWAPWCGPCRMLTPVIRELAEDLDGQIKVGKINVDEEPELAGAFRVASIPTVMAFKDGKVVSTSVGVRPKAQLAAMVR